MNKVRAYELKYGDRFTVFLKTYYASPELHNKKKFKIYEVFWYTSKKYWWQFWKRKKNCVTLEYVEEFKYET
jgi:hypothetical protein